MAAPTNGIAADKMLHFGTLLFRISGAMGICASRPNEGYTNVRIKDEHF
jgi:hypothetical protein